MPNTTHNSPLIIAHRGNSHHAPENTLPSFSSAIEAGADMVELDYRHSVDGVPFVIHDRTLSRATNSEMDDVVEETTAERLRQLDAGAWFGEKFTGTQIPTLEEAITLVQRESTTVIERKSGDANTCIELLERLGVVNDVVVMAFDWDYLRECRALAPELMLTALGDEPLNDELLDEIDSLDVQIVGWKQELIGESEIAGIHARELKAWVYTVDELDRAIELRDAGIDAIITNRPAEIRAAVS